MTENKPPSQVTLLSTLTLIQLLFGLNFSTSKIVLEVMTPIQFALIRFVVSSLTLFLYLKLKRVHRPFAFPKGRFFWPQTILLALLGISLSQTLFLSGLKQTTATNAAMIMATIPLFVLIISAVRGQTSLSRRLVFGFFISFLGVALLKGLFDFQIQWSTLQGDLLILSAAASLGLFISLSKSYFQQYPHLVGTMLMFLFGGLFMLLPLWWQGEQLVEWGEERAFWSALAFSIFGATLATYFLNNWAIRYISPAIAGLFINLQPLFAHLIGRVVLGESSSWRTVGAMALILSGVIISLAKRAPKALPHQKT